jgi:hypothetical protein
LHQLRDLDLIANYKDYHEIFSDANCEGLSLYVSRTASDGNWCGHAYKIANLRCPF